MIKLKQLLSEATIACGECLSYACKMSMFNQSEPEVEDETTVEPEEETQEDG